MNDIPVYNSEFICNGPDKRKTPGPPADGRRDIKVGDFLCKIYI